eukprot:FR737139.1.p1 GENE.FR737139.1~~FR737139.1.p1  ORF type:complete len:210 (+),score=13.97 FR737139.1:40-630(+)
MVYGTVHATNALVGGSLRSHLRTRKCRLVYAQMIRECLQAFNAAAAGGKWEPDCNASFPFPLRALELILCLPTILYMIVTFPLQTVAPKVGSPIQLDLHERRSTDLPWTIGELCNVGKKHKVKMDACSRVRDLLMEAIKAGNGVPSMPVDELYAAVGSPRRSTRELVVKIMWWVGGTCFLMTCLMMLDVLLPREGL